MAAVSLSLAWFALATQTWEFIAARTLAGVGVGLNLPAVSARRGHPAAAVVSMGAAWLYQSGGATPLFLAAAAAVLVVTWLAARLLRGGVNPGPAR